ncbi:MAG: hypothetical protein IPL17_10950 [Anaerolineales bacterium]|nr:hypothetical protein [Anaerolineales bacterium]
MEDGILKQGDALPSFMAEILQPQGLWKTSRHLVVFKFKTVKFSGK